MRAEARWVMTVAACVLLQTPQALTQNGTPGEQGVVGPRPDGTLTPLPALAVAWDATPALQTIRGAWDNARTTQYHAVPRVDEARGAYRFDCSAFAEWVLRRSYPVAARFIAQGLPHRPLARDFHSRIARIAADKPRAGWARVERVADIRPGDVIAWVKPEEIRSANTGHVVFAVLPPRRLTPDSNTYLLRVADATRLWHADDTRDWQGSEANRRIPLGQDTQDESPNDQGLGFGTISLVADPETGRPTAYGWVATQWRTFDTAVAIGRPVK